MNRLSLKHSCRAIALVLLLTFAVPAQAQDSQRFNGQWWTTLPTEFKFGFILGYQEGFKMALGQVLATNEDFPGSLHSVTPDYLNSKFYLQTNATCGEIEKELDRIYANEENKSIHVYSAITIALMKLQGLPEKAIQDAIDLHRTASGLFEEGTRQGSGKAASGSDDTKE